MASALGARRRRALAAREEGLGLVHPQVEGLDRGDVVGDVGERFVVFVGRVEGHEEGGGLLHDLEDRVRLPDADVGLVLDLVSLAHFLDLRGRRCQMRICVFPCGRAYILRFSCGCANGYYHEFELEHAAPLDRLLFHDVGVHQDLLEVWRQFLGGELVDGHLGVLRDLLVVHREIFERHDEAVDGSVQPLEVLRCIRDCVILRRRRRR